MPFELPMIGQTTDTVISRDRCHSVQGFNPANGNPAIVFHMQRLTELADGTTVSTSLPDLSTILTPENAGDSFVVDGKTYTFQEAYLMLFGLMLHLRTEAENAAANQASA